MIQLTEVRNMEKVKVCPMCGQEYVGHPALSRKDNKTKICPECGTLEAIHFFIEVMRGGDKECKNSKNR